MDRRSSRPYRLIEDQLLAVQIAGEHRGTDPSTTSAQAHPRWSWTLTTLQSVAVSIELAADHTVVVAA